MIVLCSLLGNNAIGLQCGPLSVAEISSRSECLLKSFQTFSIYTQTVATYDDTKKETNNRAKGTPLG